MAGMALVSLFVMAPMLPSIVRGQSDDAPDKRELFVESIAEEFTGLAGAVGDGKDLSTQLLKENAGGVGGDMPWAGAGTFTVATGSVAAPDPARRAVTVLVRVEDGIPVEPALFADEVLATLNDPRAWGPIDGVSFARTDDDAAADIVMTLASPATTDLLCGELPTNGYTSCGRGRPVNINGDRWVKGAAPFMDAGGTIEEYRAYVINHEVGHSLSHAHESCPAPGALAPVMLQQTLTVGTCVPNGWPNP